MAPYRSVTVAALALCAACATAPDGSDASAQAIRFTDPDCRI